MIVVAGGVGGTEPMKVTDTPKVKVSLADGSHLTGTLLSASLELTTEFGKVNIPQARMWENLPDPPEGKVWLKIEYPKPQFGF